MSNSDDFNKYAIGTAADRALTYTIASRALNRIEWIADNIDMFVGTGGSEHRVRSGATDKPLGGDSIPLVERITTHGVAPIQPAVVARHIIFVDWRRRQIFFLAIDFAEDGYEALELTGVSEHITESNVRLGQLGFAKRPDPRVHFVLENGQLVTLTYYKNEKVIGFTRYVTDGTYEAVAVIPQAAGLPDQVWFIVKRTINNATKRFVEVGDTEAAEMTGRAWTSLQTDCAKVFDLNGVSTTVFSVPHLVGKTVDVIGDGRYRGQQVVPASGIVTLPDTEPASETCEIGLHYNSIATTMRPSVEKQVVEGLQRTWQKLWIRVKDAYGGQINGNDITSYPPPDLDEIALYTGDLECNIDGMDTDGAVTIKQNLPYPMKLLALFGEIEFGEHG